jgi:hypothetical protein
MTYRTRSRRNSQYDRLEAKKTLINQTEAQTPRGRLHAVHSLNVGSEGLLKWVAVRISIGMITANYMLSFRLIEGVESESYLNKTP